MANFSRTCTKYLLVLGALVLALISVVLLTACIRGFMLWHTTDFPMIVPLIFLVLGVIMLSCSIICCRKTCRSKDNHDQEFSTPATDRPQSTIISISLPTHLVPGAPAGYQVVSTQPAVDIVQPSSSTPYSHSPGVRLSGYAAGGKQDPAEVYTPGGPVVGPPYPPPGHIPRRYSTQQPTMPPYPCPTSRPFSYPASAPYTPYPAPPPGAHDYPAPPPGAHDYNPPYNPSVDPPPYSR